MGSPISPIIANLYMEEFGAKALSTSQHLLSLWERFVDDTSVVIKSAHREEFLTHIAAENIKADSSMPFLDTLVISQSDGCLITTVFRKPTHTDQYLQWGGTATMPYLQNTVCLVHCFTGLKLYAPPHIYMKNKNTYRKS